MRFTKKQIFHSSKGRNVRYNFDIIFNQPQGFLIFDDKMLDKAESQKIELVRQQWRGNTTQVIRGIGLVTCVYVNPETDQFWIIDYRIFVPETER